MVEKRFTYKYGCVFDDKTDNAFLTLKDCCELLNELNDECEFLEVDNKSLEEGATKYAELYHKSLKEIEQLKFQNSNLMKEVAEYSRKAKELEKRERKTEKEKDCGTCKYFQIDGMFGLWCDKGHNWENVEYCSDWKGDVE